MQPKTLNVGSSLGSCLSFIMPTKYDIMRDKYYHRQCIHRFIHISTTQSSSSPHMSPREASLWQRRGFKTNQR
jgi:hypothetical protein